LPELYVVPGARGETPAKEDEMVSGMMLTFPLAVMVVVFTFVIVIHWVDSQRKERESYYKSETLRRITEAPGEGATAAVELLREDERLKEMKTREGFKIGGIITVAVGVGLTIFLHSLMSHGNSDVPYLVGLIPLFVGVAMLGYVYFMAPPLK